MVETQYTTISRLCLHPKNYQLPNDLPRRYGFPPYKGGPMHWADNIVGLDNILAGLKKYGKERTELVSKNKNYRPVSYWEPSKLLEECVSKGKSLTQVWKEREKASMSKM